jgi:hypothetical protein
MDERNQPPAGQGGSMQGDITTNQSISGDTFIIGHGGSIQRIEMVSGAPPVDREALKGGLQELYAHLGRAGLPMETLMEIQGVIGKAAKMTGEPGGKPEALAQQIQEVGEALQRSGGRVEAGTPVALSIARIAGILAPVVVGGARAVAGWFGLPLP